MANDNQSSDISVVILCYKAGQRVKTFANLVIHYLNLITTNWEIILVGNYHEGDHDETPQVVREIASTDARVKAVTLIKQGWMGWDARSGLRLCNGKIIAFIDGDEQMVAEDILKAYRLLVSENADIVMPYRRIRYDHWIRRLNSKIYNFIYNVLFPAYPVNDVHAKPKMLKRESFEKLKLTANDWFLDAEIMIQCRRYHFQLKQFPTVFYRSTHRKSFVRFDTIFEFMLNLIKARFLEFFAAKDNYKSSP